MVASLIEGISAGAGAGAGAGAAGQCGSRGKRILLVKESEQAGLVIMLFLHNLRWFRFMVISTMESVPRWRSALRIDNFIAGRTSHGRRRYRSTTRC